jgi:ABC-type transporter Mla subunit MlaD
VRVQRTDLYVGVFVIAVIVTVVGALIATSGLGIKRYDLYIRGDDATNIAVDTKIFLQGLEVGRVAAISAVPGAKPGKVEFVIRASLLAQFSDGRDLQLPDSTDAEVVTSILGASTLNLVVRASSDRMLEPGDTIVLFRAPEAMQALGRLATDLKGDIQAAIQQATTTLRSVQRLSDSMTLATGTARRFVAGIQPGTERTLQEAAANLERMRRLMDTTDARTGVTMRQLDATFEQTRRLMVSTDSLTRLVTAMGIENRPDIREILANSRFLTQQLLYVTEQLARRPTRMMSGMTLPDSLTVEGRARRTADSAQAATPPDSAPRP